jgi:hypothetical protein
VIEQQYDNVYLINWLYTIECDNALEKSILPKAQVQPQVTHRTLQRPKLKQVKLLLEDARQDKSTQAHLQATWEYLNPYFKQIFNNSTLEKNQQKNVYMWSVNKTLTLLDLLSDNEQLANSYPIDISSRARPDISNKQLFAKYLELNTHYDQKLKLNKRIEYCSLRMLLLGETKWFLALPKLAGNEKLIAQWATDNQLTAGILRELANSLKNMGE